jgi:hypothetical protein
MQEPILAVRDIKENINIGIKMLEDIKYLKSMSKCAATIAAHFLFSLAPNPSVFLQNN